MPAKEQFTCSEADLMPAGEQFICSETDLMPAREPFICSRTGEVPVREQKIGLFRGDGAGQPQVAVPVTQTGWKRVPGAVQHAEVDEVPQTEHGQVVQPGAGA